nr:enolase C-terminal domain-like protein [Herbiconiux sp. VKM Ac-2851]
MNGEPVPESDGTARWSSTGVLVVEVDAAGHRGLGYSYTSAKAASHVVEDILAPELLGMDPMNSKALFWAMAAALRNTGWAGIGASALSALDIAVHDLVAKILDVPLVTLLGSGPGTVMVYGSGGFTSYTPTELATQLAGWAAQGIGAVKMKVGREPRLDPARVASARNAVGDDVALFVDANGAYSQRQAAVLAHRFSDQSDVTWYEEPVTSDDHDGLLWLRDRVPPAMAIAAGEYGYRPKDFSDLLRGPAVDVLQIDATRAGGVTGFLMAAEQARAAHVPISTHTAPAIHAPLGAAAGAVHAEYFHDHVVIEDQLFKGVPRPHHGRIAAQTERAGHGLRLAQPDGPCLLHELVVTGPRGS